MIENPYRIFWYKIFTNDSRFQMQTTDIVLTKQLFA